MATKSTTIGSHRNRIVIPTIVAVAAVSVLWARAGTLDPPVGPIAPTMHSLDEIHASVAALSASASLGVVGALEVKANGSDWPGPDSVSPFSDVIRVLAVSQGMARSFDPGTTTGGAPQPAPLTVVLDVGPTSVPAFQALVNDVTIELTLHLIRPAAAPKGGQGTAEHYFDIKIQDGRVSSVQITHDTYNLTFVYGDIEWKDILSGESFKWTASSNP